MFQIKTILHPTDFSPNSNHAFTVAATLARDYKARLILLHVMLPSVNPFGPPPPVATMPAESQNLGTFPWPRPPFPEVLVDHRVGEGDAHEEILRLAQKEKCDLIVIGTHGRSGLQRLLIGSVAEEVLRKANCPVLAVRLPA
jgi:nucleotide-binding universal stress UspA family protein